MTTQTQKCTPLNNPNPRTVATCGWFTGAGSKGDWACVPAEPTSESLLTKTLLSARPPPGASQQYQENCRTGNHCQGMPAQHKLSAPYGTIGCIDSRKSQTQGDYRFSKFAPVNF